VADLMTLAIQFLNSELDLYATQAVVYRRSGETDIALQATPGESTRDNSNEQGFTIEERTQDWSFPLALLDFGSGEVTPDRGDTIRQTVGSRVDVWSVLPPSDNRPSYKIVGTITRRIRIHCKLTVVE